MCSMCSNAANLYCTLCTLFCTLFVCCRMPGRSHFETETLSVLDYLLQIIKGRVLYRTVLYRQLYPAKSYPKSYLWRDLVCNIIPAINPLFKGYANTKYINPNLYPIWCILYHKNQFIPFKVHFRHLIHFYRLPMVLKP